MNYVLSDEPWNVLYPNENVNSAAHSERRAMVIDGYFNTSDKGVIILDILEYVSDIFYRVSYQNVVEESMISLCILGSQIIPYQKLSIISTAKFTVSINCPASVWRNAAPFRV